MSNPAHRASTAGGNTKVRWYGASIYAKVEKGMVARVRKAAQMICSSAKANLRAQKTPASRYVRSKLIFWGGKRYAVASIGSAWQFVRTWEVGGIVKSERAKSLAIPLSAEAKRRLSVTDETDEGGGRIRRDWRTDLSVWRSPAGKVFLVKWGQASGGIGMGGMSLEYVLTPQAKVSPHPFLRPAYEANKGALVALLTSPMNLRGPGVRAVFEGI